MKTNLFIPTEFYTGIASIVCLLLIDMLFSVIRQRSVSSVIYLTTTKNKILEKILMVAVILLSIYVIPSSYFVFSAIFMISAMVATGFFMQKIITIDDKRIRYVGRWSLNRDTVDSCCLDKENGILDIRLKDGTHKQLTGIAKKHYPAIETNLKDRCPCGEG